MLENIRFFILHAHSHDKINPDMTSSTTFLSVIFQDYKMRRTIRRGKKSRRWIKSKDEKATEKDKDEYKKGIWSN